MSNLLFFRRFNSPFLNDCTSLNWTVSWGSSPLQKLFWLNWEELVKLHDIKWRTQTHKRQRWSLSLLLELLRDMRKGLWSKRIAVRFLNVLKTFWTILESKESYLKSFELWLHNKWVSSFYTLSHCTVWRDEDISRISKRIVKFREIWIHDWPVSLLAVINSLSRV